MKKYETPNYGSCEDWIEGIIKRALSKGRSYIQIGTSYSMLLIDTIKKEATLMQSFNFFDDYKSRNKEIKRAFINLNYKFTKVAQQNSSQNPIDRLKAVITIIAHAKKNSDMEGKEINEFCNSMFENVLKGVGDRLGDELEEDYTIGTLLSESMKKRINDDTIHLFIHTRAVLRAALGDTSTSPAYQEN